MLQENQDNQDFFVLIQLKVKNTIFFLIQKQYFVGKLDRHWMFHISKFGFGCKSLTLPWEQ